ncbi:MAG: hypothetical protein MUC49_22755 [Raineya sp.]|jgi:hypothetical protein|nr:hypothetical protein [Raineya sp.]
MTLKDILYCLERTKGISLQGDYYYPDNKYNFSQEYTFEQRIFLAEFESHSRYIVETIFPIIINTKDFTKVAQAFNEWSIDNYDVHFVLDYQSGNCVARSSLNFKEAACQYEMIRNALNGTGYQAGLHYPSLLKLLGKK